MLRKNYNCNEFEIIMPLLSKCPPGKTCRSGNIPKEGLNNQKRKALEDFTV
jgi:hypothetical protein